MASSASMTARSLPFSRLYLLESSLQDFYLLDELSRELCALRERLEDLLPLQAQIGSRRITATRFPLIGHNRKQ